jgi:K+-transporting ATPase ATPase A chain
VLLGFTAVTLAIPALTGNSNPGFHGISQVFYEYTSAFANNGSGFEGLGDATYLVERELCHRPGCWAAFRRWSCRWPLPRCLPASARHRKAPAALRVETPTFALTRDRGRS